MTKIELLAPAKNADIGIEAIRHGADAVYIGGPGFGARAAAGNSVEDIQRLCAYAHTFRAKVYVTLNTILYDDELPAARDLVAQLYEAGVDALITQDLALLRMDLPPIALHASTQMDNCTPERARMLEAAGYSQIVLARELSLPQIREIHAATSLPLEAFVHGALCVSYSGRCYASEYCFGRSANRGRCAQFCRLAFDLHDADGRLLAKDKHLLSLRDMNRSEHLEAMMDAGVSSFKIEGRLKDAAYVKNVTAYYRREIDRIIARRSQDYQRSSIGQTEVAFLPRLEKSFNRGFTNYFLLERTSDLWNFVTPKSMGEYVGEVSRVGRRSFSVTGNVQISNGDGLAFVNEVGILEGLRANRVEGREIFPLKMPQISRGAEVYRNEDRLWEAALARPTAERTIPLCITLTEVAGGYDLSAALSTEAGTKQKAELLCTCHFELPVEAAAKPQRENIIRNLSKLGGTPFSPSVVNVNTDGERFIPASQLGEMRRTLVETAATTLQNLHLSEREGRRGETPLDLSDAQFTYTSNVANRLAEDWLRAHGAQQVDPAFEVKRPAKAALMTCRHCLRYALDQCPKQTGRRPSWREPLALSLPDGRKFPLHFDCNRCEMQVLMPE